MNTTLFELTEKANLIFYQILKADGELSEELEQSLCEVNVELCEKLDGYSSILDRLEMESELLKKKAAGYQKISRTVERVRARLKENIKTNMMVLGVKTVSGSDIDFQLSPCEYTLEINDEILNDKWKMVVTELVPDKKMIKEALKLGDDIPGAKLTGGFKLRTIIRGRKK